MLGVFLSVELEFAMDDGIDQVTDTQITTVETIITNDELESDAVGEVIEAETYTDDVEVRKKYILCTLIFSEWENHI